jgi:Tfp pilus assembly protein PilO
MKNSWMSNDKYKYTVMLSIGILLGAILVSVFIIKPLYKSSSKLKAEVTSKDIRYESLVKKKNSLSSLQSREQELKAQAAVVGNALPSNKEVGKLFIQMDKLAGQSNGFLQSVSESENNLDYTTSSETVLEGVQRYTYSLPISFSDYTSFKGFLRRSEIALRLLSIKSIDIKASETGAIDALVTTDTFTRK